MMPIWFICIFFLCSTLADVIVTGVYQKNWPRVGHYTLRHALDLIALTLVWGVARWWF